MLLVHSLMLALASGGAACSCTRWFGSAARVSRRRTTRRARSRYSTYTEAGIVIAELILLVGFSIPAWATRTPEHAAGA